MSDTPRTDNNVGRVNNHFVFCIDTEEGDLVKADFARELERENTKLLALSCELAVEKGQLERECNRYKEALKHVTIASKQLAHPAIKCLVMKSYAKAAFEKPDTNQPNQ